MTEDFFPIENLLSFRKPQDVVAFIGSVMKNSGLRWENIGHDETNFPRLSISKSSVKAMIERITNAIDATLENEKELRKDPKDEVLISPREAIQEWFGIKGGHINFLNEKKRRELAQGKIQVVLDDSGISKRPTVTVKDFGIGLHPDEFPTSIVGLGGSLKRGKKYLLGAYGWGGSQTFIWCNGAHEATNAESLPLAIIVSRKNPKLLGINEMDEVGWTIVRYKDNPNEKHGVFQYLVSSSDGKIPRTSPKNLPKDFLYGTQVTHLAYNLESFHGMMTLSSYRLFQSLLFDPVLPFWLYDERQKEGRTISGNLTRLTTDEESVVEYHNSQEQSVFGEKEKIKFRYWVLKSKKSGYHLDSYLTKGGSSESIIITLNGQQYGTLSRQIIKDAGFSFLSEYLVFQIEFDSLSYQMKKNIFPSTREDIRDHYKDILKSEIIAILKNDEELKKLEEARKQESLMTGDEDSIKRVKRLLDKLISVNKRVITGGEEGAGKKKKKEFKSEDPPTVLKIIPENKDLKLIPGEEKKITIETNAPNDFLTRDKNPGQIECHIDNSSLAYKIRSGFLRDGKINFYVLLDENVPIGKKGTLTCSLFTSKNVTLEDKKQIEVVSMPPPLPSNYPPTIFDILNEENPLSIKKGKRSMIQIICDGPDGLLERAEDNAKIDISFIPDIGVKVIGKTDLIRHRIRVFLLCPDNIEVGKRTEVTSKLTLSNNSIFTSKRNCVIIQPPPETGDEGEKEVEMPDYDIIPVEPDDKNWNKFQWDDNAVGKYMKSGDSLILYVSLGNKYYLNTLDSSEISAQKIDAFKERYLSYMGYHLWLQHKDNLGDEGLKLELNRIIQTVLLALSQDTRLR